QRPVKRGVEHGTFQLLRYPELAGHHVASESQSAADERKRAEREDRLKMLLIGQSSIERSGLMDNRLSSFVGRKQELAKVHQHICSLLPTGGYLTITGQAGQGKSSLITKLVQI